MFGVWSRDHLPAQTRLLFLCERAYTWPGSNWRPSACEADVIATRPQVLGFIGHSLQPSRPRFVFGDPASPSSPCTRGGLPPACSNSLMHPVAWECSAWSIRIIFTMASTACPLRTMTPAGLEPAIPGSVGRCLIHWATGPIDRERHGYIQHRLLTPCLGDHPAKAHHHVHQPGIEPGSHRWQRCILPLDH